MPSSLWTLKVHLQSYVVNLALFVVNKSVFARPTSDHLEFRTFISSSKYVTNTWNFLKAVGNRSLVTEIESISTSAFSDNCPTNATASFHTKVVWLNLAAGSTVPSTT